jgi:stage III sporulation protein AB
VNLLFKITGFVFIILTTSAFGFSASAKLNSRHKKLCRLIKEISVLKEYIRLHGGETETLFKKCFSEYPINYAYLNKEDIEMLNDFLNSLGFADSKTEYERCELYIGLLNNRADEAQKQYLELNRLYKNIGVLSGILICIFFL